ncbi:hypothetical protein [Rhizobium sp. BT-226]|uniref:hypothetical protein n=1 Tax=Rhizobium sp. BT-226 TaxID=2986922 RepID=UPI0021F6CE40|nr:hypothetical protein [Rhizobium sp. BT-226]MCW0021417.1 hypothetical protein [Rhizobium sp. BT-226]
MSDFARIFLDIYREYKNNHDANAEQNAYRSLISNWGYMFKDVNKGVLSECGVSLASDLAIDDISKVDAEAMLVIGISNERGQRNTGYWRALSVDASNRTTAGCSDGCSRLYWLRRMIAK